MKTLRIFEMALVAIIMGVSLTSCSKDENPTGDKKLTKLVAVTPSGNEVGWIFTYDGNGKLNKAQFNDSGTVRHIVQPICFHGMEILLMRKQQMGQMMPNILSLKKTGL